MIPAPASQRFTTRRHRGLVWIGYLLLFGLALRRVESLDRPSDTLPVLLLAGWFAILYASYLPLIRRYPVYARLYFPLQILAVQSLAVFQEYLDSWSVLYILLGIQAVYTFSRKWALIWGLIFIGLTLATLGWEFGLLSGFGRAAAYIMVGIFLISYDIQYARREDAQAESQVLLQELQAAHQKLKEQAEQADKLAAAQEANRMAQEVHDSVGQKVFAIQLMTESTCMMLENEPGRVGDQLDLLQEQTQTALGQMRDLITRWREEMAGPPPEDGRPPAGFHLQPDL